MLGRMLGLSRALTRSVFPATILQHQLVKGTLALERFTQALAVCGTLLIPSLRHSPIVILKITYLNFTVVGFLFLINLRFVKPFSFISNHVINIVLRVVYVILVGRLYR